MAKFSHNMCHGIPQTRLIPLLPGLTAATLPLNSRRCTTQVASYHPPCFLGPYGYRAKVAPRSTTINPCVWLFLFVPGRIEFMWRFCTCTFQGSVNPWFYFFLLFFTAYCILSLVEWPAPHGLLYPMDPCTAPCNKYGIFRPRNKSLLYGAQGQEMDTYFDITTAYYSSRHSSLTCLKMKMSS